ncbi:MAG: prenyltransferase/squalene oxidase repeat-containing protein [Gemmataceae bacterium]
MAQPVIRRLDGTVESTQERLVKKHLPAWVASGAVHLVIAVLLFALFGIRTSEMQADSRVLNTTTTKEDAEPSEPLVREDPGLDGNLEATAEVEKLADKVVEGIISNDPVGTPEPNQGISAISPGAGLELLNGGTPGDNGFATRGSGDQPTSIACSEYPGRSSGAREYLSLNRGGSKNSELAVGRGLAWLARQQKPNGSWVFDGTSSADTIAATGLALLPFLAAGETHKFGEKHRQTVHRGLQFLVSQQRSDGGFNGSAVTMYSHGIATIALNEAYGMTKDRVFLHSPAQSATNFIVQKQGSDGSWGYAPGTTGDTSIVGWQIQALKAAVLAKDIVVPDKAIGDAIKFLDKVSSGSRKAVYGYSAPNGAAGTALTAVGLLSRYYVSKWAPGHAGLAEGVDGLMKRGPGKAPALPDMYYFYYATQVVHFADGDEWKTWNEGPLINGRRQGGMRDWLVALQDVKEGPNFGSWQPDGAVIGGASGRIGTTALSLLTLEVYYRHLPLYKRENAGGAAALK